MTHLNPGAPDQPQQADQPDQDGASDQLGTVSQVDEPASHAAQDDPAKWVVPLGVRTASEWSWRLTVIAIALSGLIYALSRISEIVIPVLVALLLAALLNPVKAWLQRAMPSGLASGLTVLGTLAVISGLLSFVGSQFVDQFAGIQAQVGRGYDQIREWLRTSVGISDTQIEGWIEQLRDKLQEYSGNLGQAAASAGITVTHVIAGFFIAMFTLFFFLHDGRQIWSWAVRLFPRAARAKVDSSGTIAWGQLSAFTRATILVAAVDAIGIGVIAAILGVPFASGIGVLVFFGAFVPVIGAFISGAVAVLIALVALGPVQALIMLGGVLLVQQVESHLLQPLLLGRAMRMHPLSVILAIAAGVVLAGIVGALIAVPIVAVFNAVGHHLLDQPTPPEPEGAASEPEEASAT